MVSITPENIVSIIGSKCFEDNQIIMVSYLKGDDIHKTSERINGLNNSQTFKIRVLDMRSYIEKKFWTIAGKIEDFEDENNEHELIEPIQTFYYPRDKFTLPS